MAEWVLAVRFALALLAALLTAAGCARSGFESWPASAPTDAGGEDSSTLVGDLNGDGCVDGLDLSIFSSHYGQTGSDLPGDLNGDGKVDLSDFAQLSVDWGQGCSGRDAGRLDAAALTDAAGGRDATRADAGSTIDGALCNSTVVPGTCLPEPDCLQHACTDLALLLHFDNRDDFGEGTHLVHDFSGNGNHAGCSDPLCPTWDANAGRFGGAFTFANGPRFEIADAPSLDFAEAVTVTAWFLPRSLPSAWRPVVSKVEATTERSNFWIGHEGAAMCITFNDGSWHNRCTAASYATGSWYHLAGVFDDVNDRITLYVDGAAVIDESDASELPLETGSVWIGWAPLDDPVDGVIDEVILFDRALSAAEVLELAR